MTLLSARDETALAFARSELRRVLRALSIGGLANEIRLELVGRRQAGPALGLKDDGFAIVPEAGGYRILSRRVRGLVYGVYEFLERLGCRWYFPGPEGEHIPAGPASPPDQVIVENPHTPYRSVVAFWDFTDSQRQQRIRENLDFAIRSRYNRFYLHWPEGLRAAHRLAWRRGHGLDIGVKLHTARQLLPARLFRSHPDWFRFHDGERRPDYNLCVSSPQALAEVSRNAGKLAASFDLDITDLAYWQDDVPDAWCHCPSCARLSPSDQNLRLMKAILDGVRTVYPRGRVSYLAYYATAAPPQASRIPRGIFLEWAPHSSCYRHDLDDPECPRNAVLFGYLRQNLERFGVKGARVFEYWLDLALFSYYRRPVRRMPLMPDRIQRDIRFYGDLGFAEIENVQWMPPAEAAGSPEIANPDYALVPRLLWNPGEDVVGFLRDFCRNFYGTERASDVLDLVARADRVNPRYVCAPAARGDGCRRAAVLLEEAVRLCRELESAAEGRHAERLAGLRRVLQDDQGRAAAGQA